MLKFHFIHNLWRISPRLLVEFDIFSHSAIHWFSSDLELEHVIIAGEIESEREGSTSSDVQIISDTITSEPPPRQILRPIIRASGTNVSELTYPKSQYLGWTTPMEITPEAEAVAHLIVSIHP